MKKILLAGSTGFIGKHLIPYLTENGYELSILTRRKLEDTPNVKYFQWDVEKCLSPLKGWTKIENQFSHSKFRGHENKKKVYT